MHEHIFGRVRMGKAAVFFAFLHGKTRLARIYVKVCLGGWGLTDVWLEKFECD